MAGHLSHSQRVRYLQTSDGLRLAWAEAGSGPPLVRAATWLTHLEYDWDSPVWRHWIHLFSDHFRFIRYDERGCGMSEWNTSGLSFERWAADLEEVVDAAAVREPFSLLGISQGAAVCIAYAARHPGRVSRLLIYGGYAQGWARRGDEDVAREFDAVMELATRGWARDNPAFRQVFTSRFLPQETDEQIAWFTALCAKASTGAVAATLLKMRSDIDVTPLLPSVHVPTLVIHARNDQVVPISQGQIIAAGIPNAQFIELDSTNHILLEHEPAWNAFRSA